MLPQALIDKAEYLIWMDASIRWRVSVSLETIFERSRQGGVQLIPNEGSIAVRTVRSMFQFFGDQQCQYAPFGEAQTTLLVFYNDRFVCISLLVLGSMDVDACVCMYVRTCVRVCEWWLYVHT